MGVGKGLIFNFEAVYGHLRGRGSILHNIASKHIIAQNIRDERIRKIQVISKMEPNI